MASKILSLKEELINGMIEYMGDDSEDEVGYSKKDVNKCSRILDGYLSKIKKVSEPKNENIKELVNEVVMELNELNNDCDYCLIETDQRELLCEIINLAANEAGIITEEDLTEDWRDW